MSFADNLIKITILDSGGYKSFEKICLKDKYKDIYNSWKDYGKFDGKYLNPDSYTIFTNKIYVSSDGCLEQGDCVDYETFTI